MATISEVFSTGKVTLSSTTADSVTLSAGGTRLLISNISGTETLHVNISSSTATAAADHLVVPEANTLELTAQAYGYRDGCTISIVGNGNVYCAQFLE